MANEPTTPPTIGILALQGDFEAHRKTLEDRLNAVTRQVRTIDDLAAVDALVMPGGESTTIAKLLERDGLDAAIRERALHGLPIYGTCAGMILLADSIEGRPDQPSLKLMRIRVARNAFGRQVDSFEADIPFEASDEQAETVRGVFIRAPYVLEADASVSVLSRFRERIVAVRQDNLLATAFHPELTDSALVHAYFLRMVAAERERRR